LKDKIYTTYLCQKLEVINYKFRSFDVHSTLRVPSCNRRSWICLL